MVPIIIYSDQIKKPSSTTGLAVCDCDTSVSLATQLSSFEALQLHSHNCILEIDFIKVIDLNKFFINTTYNEKFQFQS